MLGSEFAVSIRQSPLVAATIMVNTRLWLWKENAPLSSSEKSSLYYQIHTSKTLHSTSQQPTPTRTVSGDFASGQVPERRFSTLPQAIHHNASGNYV
jgi:hypothetical protein